MEIIERDGYSWYLYNEVPQYLNAEDINNIYANMQTIKVLLNAKGYTIENLASINAQKNTPFASIVDILQNIEYNLDIVNSTEIKTPLYVEPKTIGRYAPDKIAILRWIDTLNDLYYILTNQRKPWGYVLFTDGYPTIDGKRLIIRGDINWVTTLIFL